MSNRLEGKVALVTAAGQGIGRAIAEKFADEGAKVIATDLDPNKLQGLRAKLRKLDVRSQDDIDAFGRDIGREFGPLDIWSIAPVMCTRARCSIAPTRTGIFRSTSTSNRCTA